MIHRLRHSSIRAVPGADAVTRFQETEALVDQVSGETQNFAHGDSATIERLQEELKKGGARLRTALKMRRRGRASANGNGRARLRV